AARAIRHVFDLLGSGPVVVRHGAAARGVEGNRYGPAAAVSPDAGGDWLHGRINAPNQPEAARIWGLVDSGYQPIDWQLDFKSGWRWSESTRYRDIEYGRQPGADVKVPWELARLQHLPQLALAASLAQEENPEAAVALARELRNQ